MISLIKVNLREHQALVTKRSKLVFHSCNFNNHTGFSSIDQFLFVYRCLQSTIELI